MSTCPSMACWPGAATSTASRQPPSPFCRHAVRRSQEGERTSGSAFARVAPNIKAMENEKRESIVAELKHAYAGELETVQNYLANSIDLDGVRAEEIKKSLAADIQEELGHATMLAKRIKVLGGRVPGSFELERDQKFLQPPSDSTDLISVIKGVIAAEESAIAQYERVI